MPGVPGEELTELWRLQMAPCCAAIVHSPGSVLDSICHPSPAPQTASRAYVSHLLANREMLGDTLLEIHNTVSTLPSPAPWCRALQSPTRHRLSPCSTPSSTHLHAAPLPRVLQSLAPGHRQRDPLAVPRLDCKSSHASAGGGVQLDILGTHRLILTRAGLLLDSGMA